MTRETRHLALSSGVALLLSACVHSCSDGAFDRPPAFAAGAGRLAGPIRKDQQFTIGTCLQAWTSITDITVRISVPPQVEILGKHDDQVPRWDYDAFFPEGLQQRPGGSDVWWPEEHQPPGTLVGQGNMEARACFFVNVKSKTDWTEWQAPIRAHLQLRCEGELYSRDIQWSDRGTDDSTWQGNNASWHNRWLLK